MKPGESWWKAAGSMLANHPELLASAADVHGFAGGARWMHGAMRVVGWRMPPFRNPHLHARRGWMKYGLCSIAALGAALSFVAWGIAGWAWFPASAAFYAVEARMVFLFPEALLGRRAPWLAAHAMSSRAGGTLRVMSAVLPIAARMLAAGWWRGRSREMWVQGCLAVVLWHRAVAGEFPGWTDDENDLERLEYGPTGPLLLRREKIAGRGSESLRVLWISDLHWRGQSDSGTLLALLRILRKERPDLCILGGDFVERVAALDLLRRLVRGVARVSKGIALPGNHDRGKRGTAVRRMMQAEGVEWLPDAGMVRWQRESGASIEVVGSGAPPLDREVIRIVAVHDPAELDAATPACASIVLAGHLHGGQCVLASGGGRLLPAAWIYRHAWLRRQVGEVDWIVGRGVGDTVPFRWNCPREVILCEIG